MSLKRPGMGRWYALPSTFHSDEACLLLAGAVVDYARRIALGAHLERRFFWLGGGSVHRDWLHRPRECRIDTCIVDTCLFEEEKR